jgi:tetratricopeptide (TPR) repeat protein
MTKTASRNGVCLAGFLFLGACLSTVAARYVPGQEIYNPEVAQLVKKAAVLSNQGDFAGAADAYRQATNISPTDSMLRFYLGLALENKGSYAEAAQSYEKAIALQEVKRSMPIRLLANLYLHAATTYIMTNQVDLASDRVNKSLELYPDSADAISTKGTVLDMQGHLDEAIANDRKAFDMNPRSAAFAENLAVALEKKGDAKQAVTVLQTAVQSNSHDPDLLASYGDALLATNRLGDAEAAYKNSLSQRPDNATVLYNLADALRCQKKLPEALDSLQKAHSISPDDADISLSLGSLLVDMSRPEEALPFLSTASQSGKHDALSTYGMAYAFERESQPTKAFGLVEDALRSKHRFRRSYSPKGRSADGNGQGLRSRQAACHRNGKPSRKRRNEKCSRPDGPSTAKAAASGSVFSACLGLKT